ncbi:MAG: hypothetical protein INF97_12720 [Roseomonas sp.]|nr:hypothetical protein [Roseomonas sp.]
MLAPTGTPPVAVAALGTPFRAAIQQSAPRLNGLAGVVLRAAGVKPE